METRECQNCHITFTIEPEDFVFYEKIKVPPPTWCPECRLVRRLMWRNERSFFYRTCEKCGQRVLAIYPEESGIHVYCRPCWWSDGWDAKDYAQNYDPGEPFLIQLNELLRRVPLPSLFGLYSTIQNSEYSNMCGYLKDCYFVTMADWDENCMHSSNIYHCNDCLDNCVIDDSQLCYETLNCQKCNKVLFSIDCESCFDVSFSKNLSGCSDCIGCINLRNKKYCIFNEQYSKEEYEQLKNQYAPESRGKIATITAQARAFWLKFPHRFMHSRSVNNVSGDYIYNSTNTHHAFMAPECEDAKYIGLVPPGKLTDAYDHTHYGISTDMVYETLQVGNQASNIKFSWFVLTGVKNIEYSIFSVNGCSDLFGCVGLMKSQYCILNKQYTKEEYEKLREEIIRQMSDLPFVDARGREYRYGEFLPTDFAPYAYNVGSAQEFFPSTAEGTASFGYSWSPRQKRVNIPTIKACDIPDCPATSDSILKETYECAHMGECNDSCSGAFRIAAPELEFYKKFNLPLPNLCPNCRHYGRISMRNPWKLWHRKCMKTGCPNEFETSYSLDRPEIVYCETCYQQEVV